MHITNKTTTRRVLAEWEAQSFADDPYGVSTSPRLESFGNNVPRMTLGILRQGSFVCAISAYLTKDGMLSDTSREDNTGALVFADPTAGNNDLYFRGSGTWTADSSFTMSVGLKGALASLYLSVFGLLKAQEDLITAFGKRAILNLAAKFGRSGLVNVLIGVNNRIFSAYRPRDDTFLVGARAVETNNVRIDDDPKFRRSGIVGAVVDGSGRLIRGQRVRDDREVIGAAGIETRFQKWVGINPKSRNRSGFKRATIGPNNRLIDGVDKYDMPYMSGVRVLTPADVARDYVVSIKTVGGEDRVFSENRRTGKMLQLSASGTTNSDPRVEADGSVSWLQSNGSNPAYRMWSAPDVANPHRVSPMAEILIVGDSLVEQNYGATLATLAGVPVRNLGKSGSTSRGAAARMGARPMRLASSTGQIPASGSVQVSSPDGLAALSYYQDGSISNFPGKWGGIPSSLSWDKTTGQMTAARTTAGAAISARGGLPFVSDPVDSVAGTGAPIPELLERICVMHWGRNNAHEPDRIFADFKAGVSALPTRVKRFIVIPFMPTKTEVQGNQQAFTNRKRLMSLCLAEWPENTIDMLAAFIAAATSSTDDQAAVAGGYAPPSLMQSDEIHPSASGRTVEANTVYNFIAAKGWL